MNKDRSIFRFISAGPTGQRRKPSGPLLVPIHPRDAFTREYWIGKTVVLEGMDGYVGCHPPNVRVNSDANENAFFIIERAPSFFADDAVCFRFYFEAHHGCKMYLTQSEEYKGKHNIRNDTKSVIVEPGPPCLMQVFRIEPMGSGIGFTIRSSSDAYWCSDSNGNLTCRPDVCDYMKTFKINEVLGLQKENQKSWKLWKVNGARRQPWKFWKLRKHASPFRDNATYVYVQ